MTLKNVPGADSGLLFFSATSPSGTLDAPKFKTWDSAGVPINSAGGGRQVTWAPITLSRGVDDNKDLYNWFNETILKGVDTQKKDLEMTVLDSENKPLHTWNLIGAHITQYSDSGHNAQTNEILVSTVQIEYEHAELK